VLVGNAWLQHGLVAAVYKKHCLIGTKKKKTLISLKKNIICIYYYYYTQK